MTTVRVRPKDPQSTHEISLSDGSRVWGIKLNEGARGVQESPVTASNLRITGGGTKFGDYDPSMSHIEIRDWSGGRGLEDHVDDPTRYYDSENCFTLVPGELVQTFQWQISSGLRGQDQHLPGNVNWKPILGGTPFIGIGVAASTTYNADKAGLLLRKVGKPGDLTVQHRPSSGTVPDAVTINTTAVGSSVVSDVISQWVEFDWAGTVAQTSAVTYWIVAYCSTADNQANHWEIAWNSSTANGHAESVDGAAWTLATGKPYYRLLAADRPRKFHMFHTGSSALWSVSQFDSGTSASELYKLTTGTQEWGKITSTAAITSGVLGVCPMGSSLVLFARAGGIGYFKPTSSNDYVEGDQVAHRLHCFYDPVDGPQIWRANSTAATVSRAPLVAWGSSLVFTPSTSIPIGGTDQPILDITDYNDQLYVRKADSVWAVKNDRASRLPIGLEAVFETNLSAPILSKDLYLYFAWSHAIQRLYGATVDDLGPWKGAGLPSSRAGRPSAMESGIGVLFVAIDAGSSGVSSVLALAAPAQWHEVFRAPLPGLRIQTLKWDPHPSGSPRLWISCGSDLFYVTFPKDVINPLRDPTMAYQHEGVMTQATIDMGAAQLPKLFSEIHAITKGLNSNGTEVQVDYQLDDDVGSSSWITAGRMVMSPSDAVPLRRGDKHTIRLRFRLLTSVATTPTRVDAFVLEAVARTPVKRQWSVSAITGSYQVTTFGLPDHAPDKFYDWFQDSAASAKALHMHSVWEGMDDIWVFAEAPIVARDYTTPAGEWGGQFKIVIREL